MRVVVCRSASILYREVNRNAQQALQARGTVVVPVHLWLLTPNFPSFVHEQTAPCGFISYWTEATPKTTVLTKTKHELAMHAFDGSLPTPVYRKSSRNTFASRKLPKLLKSTRHRHHPSASPPRRHHRRRRRCAATATAADGGFADEGGDDDTTTKSSPPPPPPRSQAHAVDADAKDRDDHRAD